MKLTVAYSPFNHPAGGMGPFHAIFNKSVNGMYIESLKGIDAVLLWGGIDISPTLYAETPYYQSGPREPTERDLFELELCRQAHKEGKPIIGVCRGAQFICAFAGGKLVQHVTGHGVDHTINTYDGESFTVTSSHHQMLYPYDVNHMLLGWSDKHRSVIYEGCKEAETIKNKEREEPEVVYFPDVNGFAIQCHPEWHIGSNPFNDWVMKEIKQACFDTIEA